MIKEKKYQQVRFSADVLQEATRVFGQLVDPKERNAPEYYLSVEVDSSKWRHDSIEEFLADYRRTSRGAHYNARMGRNNDLDVNLLVVDTKVWTTVEVRASDRSTIEAVFEIFEKHLEASRIPEEPSSPPELPRVFIGHGGNPFWRDLKDHLHEQHGYDVIAYEIGSRAGHEIRDILEDMLSRSSFALLVMTGEDETKDSDFHPRLNVVHELGLFQGRLGFSRSIVLLEEGTQEFSNIHGVHQIRFTKGNIKETFGDVLATLKREFPDVR